MFIAIIKQCSGEKNTTIRYIRTRFFWIPEIFPVLTPANLKDGWKSQSARKLLFTRGRLSDFLACFLFQGYFIYKSLKGKNLPPEAERNSFKKENITPLRGAIYDRTGTVLVWNGEEGRMYADIPGLGHILGYTGLPSKEDFKKKPDISSENMVGKDGIEEKYEELLGEIRE